MISQGDVELSVISKNFFFTFFNFFFVFTILGTGSGFIALLERFGERLHDASIIANTLAKSLAKLLGFYTNFILLQGFGLFPLRLMEFGALSLYPINLMGAKTPRGMLTCNHQSSPSDKVQTMQSLSNLQYSAMDSSFHKRSSSSSYA